MVQLTLQSLHGTRLGSQPCSVPFSVFAFFHFPLPDRLFQYIMCMESLSLVLLLRNPTEDTLTSKYSAEIQESTNSKVIYQLCLDRNTDVLRRRVAGAFWDEGSVFSMEALSIENDASCKGSS